MEKRIILLQQAADEHASLQAQIARSDEEMASNTAAADAALAGFSGTGADRLAVYLAKAQKALELAASAEELAMQRDSLRQALGSAEGCSRESLEAAIAALTETQTQLSGRITQEDAAVQQQEEQLADFAKLTASLQQIRTQKTAAEAQLSRLRHTAECFSGSFQDTLRKRTDDYRQKLPGALHSTTPELASSSEQCMLRLCSRLALTDTLCAEEAALLILDDPLLWLDEKQFAAVSRMLQQYAEKHQILYFTCHPSRSIRHRR